VHSVSTCAKRFKTLRTSNGTPGCTAATGRIPLPGMRQEIQDRREPQAARPTTSAPPTSLLLEYLQPFSQKKSPDNICCIHRAATENNIFGVENRREHTQKDTINPRYSRIFVDIGLYRGLIVSFLVYSRRFSTLEILFSVAAQ